MQTAQTAKLLQHGPLKLTGETARPFVTVAVAWLALGLVLCMQLPSNAAMAAQWLLSFWALCLFDLVATAKSIGSGMALMNRAEDADVGALTVQLMVWGAAKLSCFGLFGLLLWVGREAPIRGIVLGLSTLLIVPLVGGYFWSQRGLR